MPGYIRILHLDSLLSGRETSNLASNPSLWVDSTSFLSEYGSYGRAILLLVDSIIENFIIFEPRFAPLS